MAQPWKLIRQYLILKTVFSIDNLKESVLTNDDILNCKKTKLNMYLCLATYFTLSEVLIKSYAASLLQNVSIVEICHFKKVMPTPKHESVQEAHYTYFPNKTTAYVICPGLRPKIPSVDGLHSVTNQYDLHSIYTYNNCRQEEKCRNYKRYDVNWHRREVIQNGTYI